MDTIQLDLSARSTTVFAALSVLPGKQRLCMGDRGKLERMMRSESRWNWRLSRPVSYRAVIVREIMLTFVFPTISCLDLGSFSYLQLCFAMSGQASVDPAMETTGPLLSCSVHREGQWREGPELCSKLGCNFRGMWTSRLFISVAFLCPACCELAITSLAT